MTFRDVFYKRIGVLLVALLFGVFLVSGCKEKKKKEEARRIKIGVVRYNELIHLHPDYKRLVEIDQEIMQIKPTVFDMGKLKQLNDDLAKKMQKYQKEMEEELRREQQAIQSETRRKVQALQDKLKAEFEKKRKDLLQYQAQLEKEYNTKQRKEKTLTSWEKEFRRRVKEQSKDLVILKERQIAAKAMELQKKSQERLMAEKNRVEKILADYEDELRKENQNKKLDLRLKIQVAKDDEERRKLQQELEAIFTEEQQKVNARRQELLKNFKKIEEEEREKNQKILADYRKKLDADVSRQLNSIKKKVAMQMYKEGIKKGEGNPFVPKEMRQKLEARQKQMQKEMEALQAQVQAQIKEIENQARRNFEAKKNQIMKKLKAYHQELVQEFETKKKLMVKSLEESNAEKKKAVERLQKQREEIYKHIISDINKQVELVAKREGVDLVLGEYEANIKAVDLTDEAKAEMSKLKKEKEKNK